MKRVHETKYIGNDFSRTVLFSRMLNWVSGRGPLRTVE
jgi:hypothetical protein